jgi:hypothetical protein
MDAIDVVLDLLMDGGCNYYINKGWGAMNMYPRCSRLGDEIHVSVNRDRLWDIVIHGPIILSKARYFDGEFNVNPVYRFDLADPNSIEELELFIKNILNTSSPA